MTKFSTFVSTAAFAAFASATTAEDSCVLVDFTAEASEFADLNAAIDLVMSANVIDSMLGQYDPLVLNDVKLSSFKYSILGQDLTIAPTIDALNVTGLTTICPEHVNASSSNCVDIGAYSDGEVSVDATISVEVKELDTSATAHVKLGLEKPSWSSNLQADVYACAPGVSPSQCSNTTIMDIETQVVSASVNKNYQSILKNVLTKVKDVEVKSFKLDFASVTSFDVSLSSSSSVLSSISNAITGYSADEINKKGDVYDKVMSTINDQVPTLLNDLIDSKLKSMFGATCLFVSKCCNMVAPTPEVDFTLGRPATSLGPRKLR